MPAAVTPKPTNLTELAKLLGVSRTLVSQVANNHKGVSINPDTRSRILAAIKEHDVSLKRKAARQVCVVEQDLPFAEQDPRALHPYFGERINLGIRRLASEEDYALSFIPMKEGWQTRVRNLAQVHAISGILMVGKADCELIEFASDCGVPTVLVDCNLATARVDSVEMDQSEMVRMAVDVLARSGAKEIAFLHPLTGHPNDEFRLMAFRYHLSTYGLPYREDLKMECVGHIHGGQIAMEKLLESGKSFDAVIGSGDYPLAGALFALRAAGKSIPEEVQLVSIGGDPICYTVSPTLANIDGGAVLIGERGLSQLLHKIESPERAPERILMRPVFTEGGSMLAPKTISP